MNENYEIYDEPAAQAPVPEPEVPAEPEVTEQTEPSAETEAAPVEDQEEEEAERLLEAETPKKKSSVQRLKEQRDAAMAELEKYRQAAQAQQPAQPEPVTFDSEPKLADFDTFEQWQQASAAYVRDSAVRAVREEMQRNQQIAAINAKFAEARTRYADFDAVLDNDLPTAPHVTALLSKHKHVGDLAYYLGKNPEVLQTLNRMPLEEAAMEIGEIAGKIKAKAETKVVKTTKAPPPITPVRGSGGAAPIDKLQGKWEQY